MSPASRLAAAVLCSSVLAVPLALAQSAPPDPAARPCKADVARLCPDAKGHAAIHACMQSKADQVSAECKAHIEEMHQKFQAAKAACQPDVQKFCQDVQPGGGRVMQCLRAHEAELSDACKAQHRH